MATLSAVLALPATEAPVPPALLQAQALVAKAQSAAQAGRLEEARSLARRARQLAPGDAAIIAQTEPVLVVPRQEPIDPVVLRAWAQAEIAQAESRADAAAAAGRHADAAEALVVVVRALAQQSLEGDPALAERLAALRARIARHQELQRRLDEATAEDQRRSRLGDARSAVAEQETLRERRRQERIDRIADLRRRGHRELALVEARRLAADEPDDARARDLLARTRADLRDGRERDQDTAAAVLREELALATAEALLPGRQDGLPDYPEDWERRSRRAPVAGALDRSAEPAWKTLLRDRLAARISLRLDGVPLSQAIQEVARQAGVNVVIDAALLAEDKPVSLDAPAIRCDNALSWITRQVGTVWALDREAVLVGGVAKAEAVLSVYDIANLVHGAQDKPGPNLTLGAGEPGTQTNAQPAEPPRQATAEDLATLIRTTVRPEVWEDEAAGITVRGTLLFITAPQDVHVLIRELLRSQEAAQGLMVRVEARWLAVEDAFFEQVGVQWTTTGSNIGFGTAPSAGVYQQWENRSIQGSARQQLPGGTTAFAAQGAPALRLSVARFGPLQLSAILEAGQRSGQIRSMEAPAITTLNGVRAHTFFGTQTGFIADYEPVQGVLDPEVRVLTSGLVLDVKPLVSSDRKYVTMDLRPATTSVRLFSDSIVSVNTRTFGQEDDDDTRLILATVSRLPIELPNVRVRAAATTVTIPDRGSLLVGGFGKAIDERMAAGIPYLSDIPYLGRLFGTRARGSERSDLYLLTTVTIIPYDEVEATL